MNNYFSPSTIAIFKKTVNYYENLKIDDALEIVKSIKDQNLMNLLSAYILFVSGKYSKCNSILSEIAKSGSIFNDNHMTILYHCISILNSSRLHHIDGATEHAKRLHTLNLELSSYNNLLELFLHGLKYASLAIYYSNIGNFEKTIKYGFMCKKIIKDNPQYGNRFVLENFSINTTILTILSIQGDLELVRKIISDQKKIANQTSHPYIISRLWKDLGMYYYRTKLFQESEKYYQKSLRAIKKISLDRSLSHQIEITYQLHQIAIQQNDDEKVFQYLYDLKQKSEKSKDSLFYYKLAKATNYMNNERAQDMVNAQRILEELLSYDIKNVSLKLRIYELLFEVYLWELKAMNSSIILKILKSLSSDIFHLISSKNLILPQIEFLILESRLELIEMDLKEAMQLLNKAEKIARKYDLDQYINKIETVKIDMELQVSRWQDTLSKNEPLSQRVRQTKIKAYLEKAKHVLGS